MASALYMSRVLPRDETEWQPDGGALPRAPVGPHMKAGTCGTCNAPVMDAHAAVLGGVAIGNGGAAIEGAAPLADALADARNALNGAV